jgi:hypothetical protein
MCRHVSDELNKMRMKEKYLNNQHNAMALTYVEVKHKLEGLEQKSAAAHEVSRGELCSAFFFPSCDCPRFAARTFCSGLSESISFTHPLRLSCHIQFL